MTSLWANERLLLSEPTAEDAEIEALQTDVMRFMAILGFILSVIFALVQSIPFAPKDLRPTLENYESLKRDITNLQNYIGNQFATLHEIQMQLKESEALKVQRVSELKQLSEQRNQLLIDAELNFTEFKVRQNNLKAIENQITNRKKSLQVLRLNVERERNALQKTQENYQLLKERILAVQQVQNQASVENNAVTSSASETMADAQRADPVEVPKGKIIERLLPPKRVGFTLKFESEAAFNRLLEKKLIRFYVFLGDKTWRVRLQNEIPEFIGVSKPTQYQEMDPTTVPALYAMHFKRTVATHGRHFEIWGVILPKSISRSIQSQIRNKQGGDVVISGEGRIRLENSNP